MGFCKLIKENSISPYQAGPLACVRMENFHLTLVGSRQHSLKKLL